MGLQYLKINNYALVESARVDFDGGLIVVTGETGAGKTILIKSLALVLGQRADNTAIRHGASEASVEALFELDSACGALPLLREKGLCALTDSELIVRRQINREGKNRCYINDQVVTLTLLREVGSMLADIMGQHEHQSLLAVENHLCYLDFFGKYKATAMASAHQHYQGLAAQVKNMRTSILSRAARIDYLTFQVEEIESAKLYQGEEEELTAQLELMKNSERLKELSLSSLEKLYERENSAYELLGAVCHDLLELTAISSDSGIDAERLEEASCVIEEVAARLRDFAAGLEFSTESIDAVADRLFAIGRLKLKHGADIAAILSRLQEMKTELTSLGNAEDQLAELETALQISQKTMAQAALKLSKSRRSVALKLERAVVTQLQDLGMEHAGFQVHFATDMAALTIEYLMQHPEVIGAGGCDQVEFMLAPNLGEGLKPMAKIASGGELSRVLLAMKVHLHKAVAGSASLRVQTLVFDEVDTGIGGSIAIKVAAKLSEVARHTQVIVITHLPHIAAYGELHLHVQKISDSKRTTSTITQLSPPERVAEVARMLSGGEDKAAILHAKEMLDARNADSKTGNPGAA